MAVFFRLLLCVALVLNGMAGAWAMAAAPAMQAAHATHMANAEAAVMAPADAAPPPCHAQKSPSVSPETPIAAPASDDCCPSPSCDCPCLHLPALALALGVLLPSAGPGPAPPARLAAAHVPPPLPHQLRPPIA